jgi:competence protein ComEC
VAPHDGVSAAIVTAVLIGDRTGLPDDIRLRLQAAGTYHVIAISGGNIAILAACSVCALLLCGIAGRPASLITLLALVAYALIVTAGASVWRATVMAVLYLLARVFDHRSPPWHAIGVAAALVVCVNPLDVRDAGFVLTFGATAALLESVRRSSRIFRDRPVMRWIVASVAASAAAEIALLPVSAWTFSRVTSAGLVLNLVAVPLMTLVQIGGMVVCALDRVGWGAAFAGWCAHAAASAIVSTAGLVDIAPWLSTRVPPPPAWLIVAYYAGLAAVLASPTPAGLWRKPYWVCASSCGALVAAAAGLAIATGVPVQAFASDVRRAETLRFTVFDVGQGDAMLLELPDASKLLVDTGGIPFGSGTFDIGGRVLAPALWARGVRRLNTVVLTHGDPDHTGGARTVIDDFGPERLWEGIRVPRHVPMRDLLSHARKRGVRVDERRSGERFDLGGARIRILHPPSPDWERQRVRNDDSIVLEVVYRDVALLLAGDIGAGVERAILGQLTPARLRILKVAHHGSRTSSSRELLESWRPQIAIISCGRGNTFGHPAPEVLRRLEAIGAAIYRTDLDGQITVESDGFNVLARSYVSATKHTKL